MEITEKWLAEIGGWQAMKAARGLLEAGLVSVQSAESGRIRGLAGHGKMKFACGLWIRSRTDVDNLCTCPAARRSLICEHSLAVVLASLKLSLGASPSAAAPKKPEPAGSIPFATVSKLCAALQPRRVSGQYFVYLPETLLIGKMREPVGVYVKFTASAEAEESLLAAWLHEKGIIGQSTPLSLSSALFAEFLQACAGHPNLIVGKPSGGGLSVAVAAEPVQLPLKVELTGVPGEIRLSLEAEGQNPLLPQLPLGWWLCRETQTLFHLPEISPELAKLVTASPQNRSLKWLIANQEFVTSSFQVEMTGVGLENFHIAPALCEYELLFEGSLQALDVTIHSILNGRRWPIFESENISLNFDIYPIEDETHKGVFYVHNVNSELRLFEQLRRLGFKSIQALRSDSDVTAMRLSGADSILRFFSSDLPRLKQHYRVVEGERWRAATRNLFRVTAQVRQYDSASSSSSGSDWLAMEFGYEAPDGFRLPRADVLRLVRSGQRSVQAKDGKRYLLDTQAIEEFEETLRDVPIQLTADGARISGLHATYFQNSGVDDVSDLPEEAATLARLGDLGARLRPYQLLGVRWMLAQAQAGRGGLLGDEMGLGKTVQSIALISLLNSQEGTERLPTLIVCPKSLTGNWRAEFEKFAPDLKVSISQGSGRAEGLKVLYHNDVIITTYQLVVRDLNQLKSQKWALILLDEASYIRNPDTDAAKALRELPSRCRLALTGTPVENSTRDLWSIYQFALPGYLGSRENFKERFEQPIQTGMDTPAGQSASQRLKKLLRPYFLRRTKREVLKDLPEKIEQILWCDPSPAQAEVYRRVLEEGREEIKAARKRSGQGGAKMTMFTVLLRLRQVCCDLRLTGLQKDALAGLDQDDLSGKWSMLLERLESVLDGGGKVLIFSQFVQYLKLVRDTLEAKQLSYAYLDGSSQDREAQVAAFQSESERRIFLISLKAGGYGLNLTAADHVILLDPWWNPAVESQAIDRAHRIGQQRVVTAYRLAIRGTVEERILALQSKKRGLVEAAIDDQSPLMTGLQESDLESLIE